MSLLLDALKKAEKAKEDANRRTQLGEGADPEATVLQVRTRNELPDISRPLEITSEDVGGGSPVPDAFSTAQTPRAPASTSYPDAQEQPAARASAKPSQSSKLPGNSEDSTSSQRAAAKQASLRSSAVPNSR